MCRSTATRNLQQQDVQTSLARGKAAASIVVRRSCVQPCAEAEKASQGRERSSRIFQVLFPTVDATTGTLVMINTAGAGVDGLGRFSSVYAIVEAAKAGASDASRAAKGFLPAAGRTLVKGLHATGYAVGYGTTFPVVLAGRLLPKNNAIGYGCIDGGAAGLDLARQTLGYTKAAAADPAQADTSGVAIAGAGT